MRALMSDSLDALAAWVDALDVPKYRAQQIYKWLLDGASFSEMTNLPRALRETLAQVAIDQPVAIETALTSQLDGTEKYRFALRDGNLIEGVLMRYRHGRTLCLSTQVGCRMGCAFCASTLDGRVRNLTPGEMLGQIVAVNRRLGEGARVHNVVLMGSGEPLDNYDNVVAFLRLMSDERGLNMSLRGVSLSTCGLIPEMYRLAEEGMPVTLCLSLHAPNDAIRAQLMPIAVAHPMDGAIEACRHYVKRTGRRVIFEYALVDGVNADMAHADELAGKLRGIQCHVNVIPLNDVPERGLKAPGAARVAAFVKRLEARHISVTRRRELGADIQGACGQLRRGIFPGENSGG